MSTGLISFTFDDGFRSTFEHAAPILRQHSMPATVGVVCDWLLWRRRWNAMSLESVRALAASGWEIASHSLFHRRMEKLPATYADEAVTGWTPRGLGVFATACPWEDVGTVAEDSAHLPRHETLETLNDAESGFFHDSANGLIYARPRIASDLDGRLKLGSTERELRESRVVLEACGFNVRSFIVPFSLWRSEWWQMGQRNYDFIATVRNGVNLPGQRAVLGRIPTRDRFSADRQIATIEEHIKQGGWPILCFHHVRPEPRTRLDWSVVEFARLVQWIADRGLTVCTLAEGARRAGINPSAQRTE